MKVRRFNQKLHTLNEGMLIMITILNLVAILIILILVGEILARIYFKRHFGIPFRSRMIGEYPYNKFIKKVAAPLHYRFVKGFRSKTVNINRFGCRGAEPEPTGQKKRLLVIGESNIFGVKLNHESELWNARLKTMLKRHGHMDWEIINAGTPIYNSTQHRLYWEQEIARVKPDIVLAGFGFNDLSQAWMMGSEWSPEVIWPEEFILALERKTTVIQRFLNNFCLYLLWRRSASNRQGFPRWNEDFQWQKCLSVLEENYRAIKKLAQAQGAEMAIFAAGFAYDLEPPPADALKLEGIQANWHAFRSERGIYDIKLIDEIRKISHKLKLPTIDLDEALRHNPRRFELYLDIVHFNDAGMRVVARTFFQKISELDWWREKGVEKTS
jgi:lysophospholipase L1-like esterase